MGAAGRGRPDQGGLEGGALLRPLAKRGTAFLGPAEPEPTLEGHRAEEGRLPSLGGGVSLGARGQMHFGDISLGAASLLQSQVRAQTEERGRGWGATGARVAPRETGLGGGVGGGGEQESLW